MPKVETRVGDLNTKLIPPNAKGDKQRFSICPACARQGLRCPVTGELTKRENLKAGKGCRNHTLVVTQCPDFSLAMGLQNSVVAQDLSGEGAAQD